MIGAVGLPGLSDRRVLVTGASRGIGRAVAEMLAGAGASVGIGYRSDRGAAESVLERCRELGPDQTHWSQAADLSDAAGCRALFERVDAEFGGLEGFVGNAGIWNAEPRPLAELELAEWTEMLDANLTSIYLTARAAVRRLSPGGRVVLISSTAAQRGEGEHSHYAASKGAIHAFVKSLATELGPRDVTVNAVAPGWVETDMSAGVLLDPGVRARVETEIPLGRVAPPQDIAGPVCFLLSDLARHITGEVLNVNGGAVRCG